VLSGFLITGILLQYRAVHTGTKYFNLRQFWFRRILRIFPLFYATLVVGCFFQVPGVIDYWKWHATYLTNVLIFVNGEIESLQYSVHFWTLAVEEQFYLLWPIVVFFLPSRHLPSAICFTIVTAPVCRSGLLGNIQMGWGLLQNQLDYLGIGAMLAYAKENRPKDQLNLIVKRAIILAPVAFIITHYVEQLGCLKQTTLAILFAAIIAVASNGFSGFCGRILENRAIVAAGRVSYGIYVLHMFVPLIWNWLLWAAPVPGYRVFQRLGISQAIFSGFVFERIAYCGITFIVVVLSWFLVERPINRCKRFFAYK
jgi:peptidoglycan/LPS O-acetylase OafA/YrhL